MNRTRKKYEKNEEALLSVEKRWLILCTSERNFDCLINSGYRRLDEEAKSLKKARQLGSETFSGLLRILRMESTQSREDAEGPKCEGIKKRTFFECEMHLDKGEGGPSRGNLRNVGQRRLSAGRSSQGMESG